MVMLEVYTRNVKVKYKAFLLSKATFITLACDFLIITLPFILCYHTGGFWQKLEMTFEQPNVKFTGDYIFLAATNDKQIISCSSFPYYNKYLKSFDNCSSIKIRESDDNYDSKVDELEIAINAELNTNVEVSSFTVVLLLNYSLNSSFSFHTESAIIHQQYNLHHIYQVQVYADLGIYQSKPIDCLYPTNTNPRLIPEYEEGHYLENLIRAYSKNIVKTTLNNAVTMFNSIKKHTFTMGLLVKYPEHTVYYNPKIWQILKFAWIQYIAIYIIIASLAFKLKSYIFKNNFVLLYKDKSMLNKNT